MSRTAYLLWTAVIFVVGFLLRLARVPRVIYLDEAWVVNSTLDLSWRDMLFHPQWLPIPPPGLLIALRGILRFIAPTELALEDLFLAISVAVMIAAAVLGRRLFDRPGALAFTAIMVLSPVAVDRSVQVKWYGSDLLVACLILILITGYVTVPGLNRYLALIATLVVGLAFSYTAIFFVLPACWAVWRVGSRAARWLRVAGCAAAPGIAGFLIWYTFVYPYRNNPNMKLYWVPFFLPSGLAIARYYAQRFADLALFIYYPNTFFSRLVPIAIGLVLIAGAWFFVSSWRNRDIRREMAIAAAFLPLAALFVLNVLRMYPLGGERTNLFALPSLAILFVAGLEGFARLLKRVPVTPVVSAALVLWIIVAAQSNMAVSSMQAADVPHALQFLEHNSTSGDAILIHPVLDEQFRFYRRVTPGPTRAFVTGGVGWTCCMRTNPFIIGPISTEVLMSDFRRVLSTSGSKRIWYVCDDAIAGPSRTKRNERAQLLPALREQGCRTSKPRYFGGITVDEIACSAP